MGRRPDSLGNDAGRTENQPWRFRPTALGGPPPFGSFESGSTVYETEHDNDQDCWVVLCFLRFSEGHVPERLCLVGLGHLGVLAIVNLRPSAAKGREPRLLDDNPSKEAFRGPPGDPWNSRKPSNLGHGHHFPFSVHLTHISVRASRCAHRSPLGTESLVADAPDWLPMFYRQVCMRRTRQQISVT
jgi:hypothetical protein